MFDQTAGEPELQPETCGFSEGGCPSRAGSAQNISDASGSLASVW